jgi:hypothetical protein
MININHYKNKTILLPYSFTYTKSNNKKLGTDRDNSPNLPH